MEQEGGAMSDLISREVACGNCGLKKSSFCNSCTVKIAPAVDAVEVVYGKWLLGGRCSNCLANPLTTHKTYCPNCGARMDGE